MKNYICTECVYVYCQDREDPDRNDIPKGTPFEKVPNDWVCPGCGSPKRDFKECNKDNKECNDEC